MRHTMEILDCAVWTDNAPIQFVVASTAERLIEGPLNPRAIVGMDPLEQLLVRRRPLGRISPEDAKVLRRPVQRISGHIPRPTPRVTEPLPFGEIGLAAPQFFLGHLALNNILHEPDEVLDRAVRAAPALRRHDAMDDLAVRADSALFHGM